MTAVYFRKGSKAEQTKIKERKIMLKLVLIITMLLFNHGMANIVFKGIPTKKLEASKKSEKKITLTAEEALKLDLKINKIDTSFYWETRGGRELIRSMSGIFMNFIDPLGGGYIKIHTETGDYF